MKIDKIKQIVEFQRVTYNQQIKTKDFTIIPIGENKATLKTNPGKTLNNLEMNFGADPQEAQDINEKIIDGLGVKLLSNTSIEYCVDVKTDFKLVNNKHILKIFLKALEVHKYRSGKADFTIRDYKWIDQTDLKEIKGYKSSRTMKIYSKYEEQGLGHLDGDLIRLELMLGTRALKQNEINNITDVEKAKQEIRELLETMVTMLPSRMNRYSSSTKILIKKLLQEL